MLSEQEKIIKAKILSAEDALRKRNEWKALGKKVVFTNGVFDILHAGHVQSLARAAACGNRLIVGLNADSSVRKLKGPERPVIGQDDRACLLAALFFVDAIVLFEEETPRSLIVLLMPDVLVKSADYTIEQIAGAKEVLENGGAVELMPFLPGISSSAIIEKIRTGK
ncbi:D-beta-D-heptose 1-phosphate adenosyltransferase [Niabella ginsenosidivorans]|uniref:D-glycero-beta-D-manno-heptose 1-phosphate adenylyltransferase n=1 Tax=Niabella ginsenosidivorans TaxID=1176587 RepID=A0A1A9I0X4_9BACT|nr:D-glycero-beta-D-manno-heptose 1-phosphate adenylyltransferase [Niabella ginsenosidivorans]ANH81276.1 D-beta-D-heptose 1-phosphate adenosyltransferase [Niabella ginsenosidivorans]